MDWRIQSHRILTPPMTSLIQMIGNMPPIEILRRCLWRCLSGAEGTVFAIRDKVGEAIVVLGLTFMGIVRTITHLGDMFRIIV